MATPIGNLSDLSHRAASTLSCADIVAAEDTRSARRLLSHLGISKPTLRCDEHREDAATEAILRHLRDGRSVALVSDAGTPGVSDPGRRLVKRAASEGFRVTPVPGPSSISALLSVSGFSTTPFCFLGFPPRRKGKRRTFLRHALESGVTFVLFESPHRAAATVADIASIDPERPVVLGRELTKLHEEILHTTALDLSAVLSQKPLRGEITLAVSGASRRVLGAEEE